MISNYQTIFDYRVAGGSSLGDSLVSKVLSLDFVVVNREN
jgi:hypothetical protein